MVCQLNINKIVLKRERDTELGLITLGLQCSFYLDLVSLFHTHTHHGLFLFSSSFKSISNLEILFTIMRHY